MSATGCVCVVGGGGGSSTGDVTFLWKFGGRTCAELQDVTTVTIQIPGQTLQNNGSYDCLTQGTAGITLLKFRAATYQYAIQGRNAQGNVLYEANGSFTVDGDVTVDVNMTASSTAPSYAYVTWTFPQVGTIASPNCTQAGIVFVEVSVDGAQPARLNCADGHMTSGVLISNIVGGQHTIDLRATDATGFQYFGKLSNLTTIAGTAVSASYGLDWSVGSLPLKWSISSNGLQVSCGQAGITQMNINLQDAQGAYVYGTAGVNVACDTSGVQGTLFLYLYPGTYRLYLQAYGTGNLLFRSNFTTPPQVAVAAGQFPNIDAATPIVIVSNP